MQDIHEETQRPASSFSDRVLSTALIWRLAQIVLVLAAAYLYFYFGSFAAALQQLRVFGTPHGAFLLRLVVVGVGMGLCIGFALKDFSKGEVVFAPDWPTLLINLVASGIFVAIAFSFELGALRNEKYIHGLLLAAATQGPLLPFIWVGLTLTTPLQPKPAELG